MVDSFEFKIEEKLEEWRARSGKMALNQQPPFINPVSDLNYTFSFHFTLFIEHFTTVPADQSAVQSRNTQLAAKQQRLAHPLKG